MLFELSNLPRPVIRHVSGLWRQRWVIVAVAWLVALLGWFAVWLMPDKYESRAHVFVQTETILEPVLNGFTARPDYTDRVDVMQMQLLTRPNVEEIIRRSGLSDTISAGNATERRAKIEGMINMIAEQIMIESPRDMYFIISFEHQNPEIARAVVDAVMNMLIEQDIGASLSESDAARRRLDLQIEEFEEKLTANEQAVAKFRGENAAGLATTQGTIRRRELKENELARVGDELDRTKGRILTLQNLLSATPRTTSGDELDRLRVQLADLRSQYQEGHPDIRGVLARIEQLEQGGGGALSSNPEHIRLSSELSVARDSVATLEARQERLREELESLDIASGQAPAVEAELRQIIREYEQTQKTYEELLSRRDRLELTRNLGPAGRGVEYQIFERPQISLIPSDPPRMLLIVGVLVLAAGAGAGVAFLLTVIDKSYSQSSELQEAFGLPVLGALSEFPSKIVKEKRRRDWRRLALAFGCLALFCGAYAYLAVMRLPSVSPTELSAVSVASKSEFVS